MAKRYAMPRKASKRDFRKKASKINGKNGLSPMRGGIRA